MVSLTKKLAALEAKAEAAMEKSVIQAGKNIGAGIWTLETAQLYLKNKAIELGLD